MSWLGQWFDRFRGRSDRAWTGSVSELLYDGESIEQRVSLGDGNRVVVTSHRLLAFTPGSDGQNYRGVDLPNVADTRAGYEGERNLLWQGGRTLLYGAIVLAVGLFLDFEAFVPTDAFQQTGAAGQLGMGGLLSLLQRFLTLIARIDEFARIIGAMLVIFAMFIFGVYVLTRDRVLVIQVAGDEERIHVPASEETLERAVTDLEAALFGTGATVGSGAVADATVSEAPVERPVRETQRTDVSESVDEVLGGSDDTGAGTDTDSATETDSAERPDDD